MCRRTPSLLRSLARAARTIFVELGPINCSDGKCPPGRARSPTGAPNPAKLTREGLAHLVLPSRIDDCSNSAILVSATAAVPEQMGELWRPRALSRGGLGDVLQLCELFGPTWKCPEARLHASSIRLSCLTMTHRPLDPKTPRSPRAGSSWPCRPRTGQGRHVANPRSDLRFVEGSLQTILGRQRLAASRTCRETCSSVLPGAQTIFRRSEAARFSLEI